MDGKTKANVENVFIGSFFPVLLPWGKQSLPNHSEIKSFTRAANKTDRCRLRFLNTICILMFWNVPNMSVNCMPQRNQGCFKRLKALHAALPRRDTRDNPLYLKKNNRLLAVYKVLIQMPSAATNNCCQFCDIKEWEQSPIKFIPSTPSRNFCSKKKFVQKPYSVVSWRIDYVPL